MTANTKVNPNITELHQTTAMQINTRFLFLKIKNFLIGFQFTFLSIN